MDRVKLMELLNADIDSLYADLGEELTAPSIMPRPIQKLIATAKAWLSSQGANFKNAICGNERILQLLESEDSPERRILLIAAIADLIAGIYVGISPITVAVLLVREGIESLCVN